MASPQPNVVAFPRPREEKKHVITTAGSIKACVAPATGEREYAVADTKGLSLRVTAKNARSWSWRYANAQQKMKRLVLGPFDDEGKRGLTLAQAKDEVGRLRGLLREGKDPAHIKTLRVTATTFSFLVSEWLAKKAPLLRGKGVREKKALDAEFSHWNDRVADEIAQSDALEVLDRKTQQGKLAMQALLQSTLSRIYRWGIKRGLVTTNPVATVEKNKVPGRKRFLDPTEIVRVWAACETQPVHIEVWMKLRLVLGQRGGELLLMRRQDINPKTHWWTIPGNGLIEARDGKTSFTKNGLDQPVYLTALARELLAKLPQSPKDGPYDPVWVFPCGPTVITMGKNKGTMSKGANTSKLNVMGDYAKIGARIAQPSRANLVDTKVERRRDKNGQLLRATSTFRGHDLRRTMTTYIRELGVSKDDTRLIINHATPENADGALGHYDISTQHQLKRAIWEFWERVLRTLLAGESVEDMRWVKPGEEALANDASKQLLAATRALLAEDLHKLPAHKRAALEALWGAQ